MIKKNNFSRSAMPLRIFDASVVQGICCFDSYSFFKLLYIKFFFLGECNFQISGELASSLICKIYSSAMQRLKLLNFVFLEKSYNA